jgi:hypothetical protein
MYDKALLVVFCFFLISCSDDSNKIGRQQEIEKSKAAAAAIEMATKLTDKNDPSGFLKLYEIAKDDDMYTVEYSEVAAQELVLLLYSKTEIWIKVFSKIDQKEFFDYLNHGGLPMTVLPNGVASEKDFAIVILENFRKIKAQGTEAALINYLTQIFEKLVKE